MKLKNILLSHWQIITILILAAILRFWRLEALTTFGGDQGYDFLIVKQILEGNLTLLGPKIGPYNEIGNLYLGPAYYYLLAPFLFLFRLDPIGASVLTVLFSLGTIILIYIIGIKFFSKKVGVISAFLFASNAFIINQSRAASNPHLIPFFSALAILSILIALQNKKKVIVWLIICGISLGIIFQLHYLASSLLTSIVLILIFKKKISRVVIIIVGLIMAISPQILFEIKHDFFTTNLFLRQVSQEDSIFSVANLPIKINNSLQSLNGVLFQNNLLLILLLLIAFILFVKNYTHKPNIKTEYILIVSLPIIFNLFFASLYFDNMVPHYFTTIYPSTFLILGIVLVWLSGTYKNNISVKYLPILFLLIYAIYNSLNLNLNRIEGYTMPKGWNSTGVKKASQIISEDAPTIKTFNIAATLDGDTRARPYRYLVEVMGKKPLDVEKYPESDVLYLISRDVEQKVYKYSVWEVSSFAPFTIESKWPIQNGISLYKLVKKN